MHHPPRDLLLLFLSFLVAQARESYSLSSSPQDYSLVALSTVLHHSPNLPLFETLDSSTLPKLTFPCHVD
ncbi:hypothetical protein D3C80_2093250 [compost metagenome]